jgi:PAS domain S-box-containing protein
VFWGQAEVSTLEHHQHGKVWVVMHQDITEHKRMETAFQESEERFHSLFKNSTIGLYRTSQDGKILLANPALITMLGYSAFEELATRDLEKDGYAPGYERSNFRQQIENAGEIKGFESAWTRKDGSTIFVQESARIIRDNTGNILYYEGTVEDITEYIQADAKLRESEQRYRRMFNNHHAVMLLINPDSGQIVDANTAACAFYGYSHAEMIASSITDINILSQEQFVQAMQKVKSEELRHLFFKHHLKSGEIRDVVVFSGPIEIEGQNLLYSIIHDITERRQAEEALRESERKFKNIVTFGASLE